MAMHSLSPMIWIVHDTPNKIIYVEIFINIQLLLNFCTCNQNPFSLCNQLVSYIKNMKTQNKPIKHFKFNCLISHKYCFTIYLSNYQPTQSLIQYLSIGTLYNHQTLYDKSLISCLFLNGVHVHQTDICSPTYPYVQKVYILSNHLFSKEVVTNLCFATDGQKNMIISFY